MGIAALVLYYAVDRNSPELVTLLIAFGGNPNGLSHGNGIVPPLAFAVSHAHLKPLDTTEIVKEVLSASADPATIPRYMGNLSETTSEGNPRRATGNVQDSKGATDIPVHIWQTVSILRSATLPVAQVFYGTRVTVCEDA
jgi:hypothetical protein